MLDEIFGQDFNGDSKFDFQTQIHNNNTQNDPYICLQQGIEPKLEKKRQEEKKFSDLPRGVSSDSSREEETRKSPSK